MIWRGVFLILPLLMDKIHGTTSVGTVDTWDIPRNIDIANIAVLKPFELVRCIFSINSIAARFFSPICIEEEAPRLCLRWWASIRCSGAGNYGDEKRREGRAGNDGSEQGDATRGRVGLTGDDCFIILVMIGSSVHKCLKCSSLAIVPLLPPTLGRRPFCMWSALKMW